MGGILGIAGSNIGQAGLNSAMQTTQAAQGYNPQQVTGSTYSPYSNTNVATTGYSPSTTYTGNAALAQSANAGRAATSQAAQINPNSIGALSTSPVTAAQIANYQNPYTSQVVDTTNADLERARQIQRVADQQSSTADGAFGGARSGVADSLTNEAYLRTLASQDANLNSAGFNTALSAAQNDQGLNLAAQQGNQNAQLQVAGQNAGYSQAANLANQAAINAQNQYNASNRQATNLTNAAAQNAMTGTNLAALNTGSQFNAANTLAANQANAGAINTQSLANQAAQNAAGQFNAGNNQQASLANQSAGLAGQNLNLAAGAQQAQLSAQQIAQALGLQQAGLNVGNQQQAQQQAQDTTGYTNYQNQQNWPLMLQQLLNQSLGLAGNPVLGTSQSTGTSKSSGFNFGIPVSSGGGG